MRLEGGQMGEGFLLVLEVVVADEYKPPSSGMTVGSSSGGGFLQLLTRPLGDSSSPVFIFQPFQQI